MTIGETIHYLRLQQGLSQKALSKLCGISRNSISRYENDEVMPRMPQLNQIAKVFDMTAVELMNYSEKKTLTVKDMFDMDLNGARIDHPFTPLKKVLDRNLQKQRAEYDKAVLELRNSSYRQLISMLDTLNQEAIQKTLVYVDDLKKSGGYVRNDEPRNAEKFKRSDE